MVCSSSSSSSSSSSTATVTTMTTVVTSLNCNGSSYKPLGNIHFNNDTNITNCVFNNSNVQFFSSPVVYLSNCTFVNSSLLIEGENVSQVTVDSCSFVTNSTFVVQSTRARVIINNSEFIHSNRKNSNWRETDDRNYNLPILSPVTIANSNDVVIQSCNFTNNPRAVAVKLLGVRVSLVSESNFVNNFLSIYTTSISTTITRCNFSKHDNVVGVVYSFGLIDKFNKLDIQDSHFFDNIFQIQAAVLARTRLQVSRSIFRNNTLKLNTGNYSPNGAAIHLQVKISAIRRVSF